MLSAPELLSHRAVRVPVATLFAAPDAVRPVDTPALGTVPDVAAWVTGLGDAWMGDGVLTQLLLGERVLVEEVAGDWARVVAVDQPAARLDPRGYPGWLPLAQLADPAPGVPPDHVVDVTATTLRERPGGQPVLTGVVLGTRLAAAGPPEAGHLPVHLPGSRTAFAPTSDVASRTGDPSALSVARRLLGTPYVWGGTTPYGIDCSGLVRLAWWQLGVTVPRDASDQGAALPAVPLGEERPGDLYLFARPGEPIHHIGFAAAAPDGDRRWLLHASSTRRRVVSEPMPAGATETLVGACRVR